MAAAGSPDVASCPNSGCAAPDSPHGLANFASLQQQADGLVGEDQKVKANDRGKFKGLAVANGQVSEGDVVSITSCPGGRP